jgi:hypothetical protein
MDAMLMIVDTLEETITKKKRIEEQKERWKALR